jgi:ATP-dependent Clp protease ATP-binding subunit ClpC
VLGPVFERFSDRARRVVVLAQEEARMLNHDHIGTEHILLGLVREGEGVAARVLTALEIGLDDVRSEVEQIIGQGQSAPAAQIPFTPRAKKVMELSLREALQLGHNYIGTEHILLGLVREGEGVGAEVLKKRGATLDGVRAHVVSLLSGEAGGSAEAAMTPAGEPAAHDEPLCPRCRARLTETATYRVLDVASAEGGEARAVTFAFCRRCGTWLGSLA